MSKHMIHSLGSQTFTHQMLNHMYMHRNGNLSDLIEKRNKKNKKTNHANIF